MDSLLTKYQLKEWLYNNVVTVVFEKVDGSERVMNCTLLTEYLPQKNDQPQLLTEDRNSDSVSVWDIDKKSWRSFRISSVKDVRVN